MSTQSQQAAPFLALPVLHAFQDAEDHFGMPAWEPPVQAAMTVLRRQDPNLVGTDPDEVERALLTAPYELGADTPDWFAWDPVLTP